MYNKVLLFPLNNSILFKKVTLPFHIFESRYRKMIRDSIDMQLPIAVVPFNPLNDYEGEICVAGMPHILTTYDDGRMDIYITGAVKCRLNSLENETPYMSYTYSELDENLYIDESLEMEIESLKILLERWAMHFLHDPVQRDNFSNTLEDYEVLVNYCSVFLLDDLKMKKAVMQAETMRKKIKILLSVIGPKEVSLGPFMPTLRF